MSHFNIDHGSLIVHTRDLSCFYQQPLCSFVSSEKYASLTSDSTHAFKQTHLPTPHHYPSNAKKSYPHFPNLVLS
jgi:hypothetical protein